MGAKPLVRPSARLYDEDFVLWTAETARLLREGHSAEIDEQHLAEEIEDMGNRDRREVLSRLTLDHPALAQVAISASCCG